MKKILTIAGSDSGGGAGIQADLKAITLLGGFGMSVVTALTAQNTVGVQGIYEIPASFVEKQIDSVLSDIGADAIKTGMLANQEIIDIVSKKIRQYRIKKVVVDPVMISKSGAPLLKEGAQSALIKKLLPLAWVVTPNLMEASAITGLKVHSIDTMKESAHHIFQLGAKHVVVKGGHLKGMAVDLLFDGDRFIEIKRQRIETKNTHGTGCTFASAIATQLAKGDSVEEAVKKAKDFITHAIQSGFDLGKGVGPTNPSAYFFMEIERHQILQELKSAVEVLKEEKVGHLIPEVSSNLGYALSQAKGIEDIAAFPGRIMRLRDSIATYHDPEFGASQHIAKIILTTMKFNPEYRSAMNIRYSKENVALFKKQGLNASYFDRSLEPKKVKEKEGSSLEWGVGEVLKRMKTIPDFIYDKGDVGKEPMIRLLGKTPMEVVHKLLKGIGRTP